MIKLYCSDRPYLETKEVASRLVQSLPTVLVDWARGNRIIQEELDRLIESNTPDVILDSHRSLFDNTPYIQIWLPEYPHNFAYCVLDPYQPFALKSNTPETSGFLMTV